VCLRALSYHSSGKLKNHISEIVEKNHVGHIYLCIHVH